MPFSFPFYGTTTDTVYVTNKGYVRFLPTSDNQVTTGGSFPTGSSNLRRVIASLRYRQAPDFQAEGYMLLDGQTGATLIAPSILHRGA